MLEANYLTILVKPNYEKTIDYAEDVLDRGLTLIWPPVQEPYMEENMNSPYEITRRLAEMTIIAEVMFCFILKNYILVFNFPERIGINMIRWLKMWLNTAILFMKRRSFTMRN